MLEPGKRFAVFSIKKTERGVIWTRAGNAQINRDGSMNIYLDVLPLEGKLHVREPGEKRDSAPMPLVEEPALAAGGH